MCKRCAMVKKHCVCKHDDFVCTTIVFSHPFNPLCSSMSQRWTLSPWWSSSSTQLFWINGCWKTNRRLTSAESPRLATISSSLLTASRQWGKLCRRWAFSPWSICLFKSYQRSSGHLVMDTWNMLSSMEIIGSRLPESWAKMNIWNGSVIWSQYVIVTLTLFVFCKITDLHVAKMPSQQLHVLGSVQERTSWQGSCSLGWVGDLFPHQALPSSGTVLVKNRELQDHQLAKISSLFGISTVA